MKKLFALLLVASTLSCRKNEDITIQPDPKLGPVQEAEGTLSDYGAVDGCSLRFIVERSAAVTDEYAISDSSTAVVKQYVVYTNAVANMKATVRFQQTSRRKNVSCGWAGPKPLDEIVILSIKPR